MKKVSKKQIINNIEKYGKWDGYVSTSKMTPKDNGNPFKPFFPRTYFKNDLEKVNGAASEFERQLGGISWHNCNEKNGRKLIFWED